ncbi:MAG: hypothetical protein AN483_06055 [Aphanizomenon flos-aquae MDT14a]|nr:MAG: hypothetical protein AN483_06055 [Aphanizomenon flos-aquae MDT14a]
MIINSFPKIVKNILEGLPKNDYPVLNSRLFVECWLAYALDNSLRSMRDLFNIDRFLLEKKVKQSVQLNSFIATFTDIVLLIFAGYIVNITMPEAFNHDNVLAFRVVVFMNTIFFLNATGYWILFSLKNSILKSAINLFVFGVLSLVLIALGSAKFDSWGALLSNFA